MFTKEINELAEKLNRSEDLNELEEDYLRHNGRYIYKTSLSEKLINQTEPKVLFGYNSLKLIQHLLFRSKSLIEGSVILLNHKRMLPALINVRAHFETTGSIAYLLKRLKSYYSGNINFERLDEDLLRLSIGATSIEHKECPAPINVMTLIDAVDYAITKEIVRDKSVPKDMFTDLYKLLSDYCHPNFHGISGGSEILHAEKEIIYYETDTLLDRDFPFFFYLNTSAKLFLHFYDEMFLLLNEKEVMPIITKSSD